MIIACVNCNKKFNVDSQLIPDEGRTIQCGSCNHTWFYNKNHDFILDKPDKIFNKKKTDISIDQKPIRQTPKTKNKDDNILNKKNIMINSNKNSELVKYQTQTNFSFIGLMSYLLVAIITFIALIIFLDTFKSPLYNFFPKLEFFLFNLYETLKDINLFIKDLI